MSQKILIIDDDTDVRTMLSRFLELEGFRADMTGTGEEGLRFALKGDYNLILLDMRLPDIYGLSLLKSLKQELSLSDTPVIMMTGMDEPDEKEWALQNGAHDFLVKPIRLEDLLDKVCQVTCCNG